MRIKQLYMSKMCSCCPSFSVAIGAENRLWKRFCLLALLFTVFFLKVSAQTVNEVYLDDRENHAWSYYSDPECLVRSLNPADVKITYYGYGTNTMYSSAAASPTGTPDVSVAADRVGIGIDAPEKNTYVYWKTLERVNGESASSKAAADGPCFYRLIPNPYSRRPTHGSGSTRWRGFYKWRLKNLHGGSVYRDTAMTRPVAVGAMLDAEDTVYFLPAAEYGMDVVFEAIWARAFVYPTLVAFDRSPTGQYATGRNAYERNFVVYTCDNCLWQRDRAGIGKGFTMTSVYPDGTDGVSPVLLTEVPSFGTPGGGCTIRSLTRVRVNNTNTGVPVPQVFSDGVVWRNGTQSYTKDTTGTFTGYVSGESLFFDRTETKFEYIKLSPHRRRIYHLFVLRGDYGPANQEGIVWIWPYNFTTNNPGKYYDASVAQVLGYKEWPFRLWRAHASDAMLDTLYCRAEANEPIITGNKDIKAGKIVYGRMCLPDDSCDFFLNRAPLVGISLADTLASDPHPKQISYRLESGSFLEYRGSNVSMWAVGAGSDANHLNIRGKISLDMVLGSDYDRSLGDNGKLHVSAPYGGDRVDFLDPVNKDTRMFNYVVKSGTVRYGRFGAQVAPGATATAHAGFYLTASTSWGYMGARVILMEGGQLETIAGGIDPTEKINVAIDTFATQVRLYIKGGTITRGAWGAAAQANAVGNRRMVFTGGDHSCWIAGGCNGLLTIRGETYGNSYIYFGGNARLQHDTIHDTPFYYSKGGNIFGAGSGNSGATGDDATVGRIYNSHIVVADSAYISRNVYGGGNYGYIMGDSSAIQILGGKVQGKVFGGANQQRGKKVSITMRDGLVVGGIHGGSNLLGTVAGPITVRIEGGVVGRSGCADSIGNVFGCGYGIGTSVTGNVNVIIGREDTRTPHINNPLIHGNVYGGGFMGAYNATGRLFRVTTYNGRIVKSVYGGGFGTSATITGNTNVNILGTTYVGGNVYGGGNMGKVTGNTLVVIGDDTSSYTLAVQSANTAWGTVSGGGVYQANTAASISATATPGYRFKQWDDGNTQNPRTVTVVGNATYTAQFMEDPFNWIDLGLPSRMLWADANIGANSPEEYGGYYAWGEITTKSAYTWPAYIHCNGAGNKLTKYCDNASSGNNGYTDNLTTLQPQDDVATTTLGSDAHIPTSAEWNELISNTTQTNDTLNGVAGRRLTSKKNGNSIFFPYAGYMNGINPTNAGTTALFWTASYGTYSPSTAEIAYFNNSTGRVSNGSRLFGQSIRAVRRSN